MKPADPHDMYCVEDMPMTVYCEDCDFMHTSSRNGQSFNAMCMKFPRPSGSGFVTRRAWDRDPPYRYCRHINESGDCPLFEPRRTPEGET